MSDFYTQELENWLDKKPKNEIVDINSWSDESGIVHIVKEYADGAKGYVMCSQRVWELLLKIGEENVSKG